MAIAEWSEFRARPTTVVTVASASTRGAVAGSIAAGRDLTPSTLCAEPGPGGRGAGDGAAAQQLAGRGGALRAGGTTHVARRGGEGQQRGSEARGAPRLVCDPVRRLDEAPEHHEPLGGDEGPRDLCGGRGAGRVGKGEGEPGRGTVGGECGTPRTGGGGVTEAAGGSSPSSRPKFARAQATQASLRRGKEGRRKEAQACGGTSSWRSAGIQGSAKGRRRAHVL